LRLSEAW